MIRRQRWFYWISSAAFLLLAASCDDLGAGCGCAMRPLPATGLPADQTLEGGAQMRVTPAGFEKITSLITGFIDDTISGGVCIDQQRDVFLTFDICIDDDGPCTPGCFLDAAVDSLTLQPSTDPDDDPLHTLQVDIQFDASTTITTVICDLDTTITDGSIRGKINADIDPATGELVVAMTDFDITNTGLEIDGCLGLGELVEFLLESFPSLIEDQIRPLIEGFLTDLLPDPLGLEGVMDVSELIGLGSQGDAAELEIRAIPGGFAELHNGGMTLGVIIGANSDRDPDTRSVALDSEPARCVPPLPTPDYSVAPASLPMSSRGTFILEAADEFLGNPEPDADVSLGVSETALDLAGHHAVASGALCLGLGSELVPQLNLSTISILLGTGWAPLISQQGTDPLLLVTRPLRAVDFAIGDGTETSPSVQVMVSEFEIDFYAFVLERYIRAFTVNIALDVGINLEVMTNGDGTTSLLPVLTGLETENIQVQVLNAEILDKPTDEIETVLPAVLDLALPLITGALPSVELPEIAGFQLDNLSIGKQTTSQDEFLTVRATMTPSAALQALAESYPSIKAQLDKAEQNATGFKAAPLEPLERAETRARLREVRAPAPEVIRAGLAGRPDGAIPEIVIDVETHDELGRALEWTWNINGGMWRPFTSAAPLVVRDRALAWQGRYDIGIRSRIVGEYRTLDLDPLIIPAVVDSVPPHIYSAEARLSGDTLSVPTFDLVTEKSAIELAFGDPRDDQPATSWSRDAVDVDDVAGLAYKGHVRVYARDELGNTSTADLDLDGLGGSRDLGSGCGCTANAGGSAGITSQMAGPMALAVLVMLMLGLRRRHVLAVSRTARAVATSRAGRHVTRCLGVVGAVVLMSTLPACDCSGTDVACNFATDCEPQEGSAALCLNNMCVYEPVPLRIGRFSELALTSSGEAYISAYNEQHGDLCVTLAPEAGEIADTAWEYVDGVPEGPVIFEGSERRNGILDEGSDVGQFTSVAVGLKDEVMVSYFDSDNASLKFAVKVDGAWQIHTVDEGVPGRVVASGFEIAGQFSSLTIRKDRGFPGIAYLAHIGDAESGEERTELRFASAQVEHPSSVDDWVFYVVDQAIVPASDDPDPLPIPPGTGLFIDSTRASDQTPVIAYYDRLNGDLQLATFNLTEGTFNPPQTLDGSDGSDVGLYPSVAVDADDTVHVTYVSASNDDLLYVNTIDNLPEVVDDGYREAGTTADGLPRPEFHLVGDDSSLAMTDSGPVVAYQDATTHELLLAVRDSAGVWQYRAVAGNEQDFNGAYGFYISSVFDGQDLVISNWVLHPGQNRVWVELFRTSPTM